MTITRTFLVEDQPTRSGSAMDVRGSPFLTRTSMFLKKVTLLRGGRRKSEDRRNSSLLSRTARADELGHKTFGMSQPALGVRTSQPLVDFEGRSDVSPATSSSPSCVSHHQSPDISLGPPNPPLRAQNVQGLPATVSSPGTFQMPETHPTRKTDGLPISEHNILGFEASATAPAMLNSQAVAKPNISDNDVGLTDSDSHNSAQTFHSAIESLHHSPSGRHFHLSSDDAPTRNATSNTVINAPGPSVAPTLHPAITSPRTPGQPRKLADLCVPGSSSHTMSLPSRNLSPPKPDIPFSVPGSVVMEYAPSPTSTAGSATPRPMHPRLASLPPPMMQCYTMQGSVRLTPSVVARQPPMPILNLPTLPPPTPPPTAAQVRSPVRLRSVPALPLRGPSEVDVEDADQDNADLDEMEEVDEEDEDGAQVQDSDEDDDMSSPSMEIPLPGRRLRSPLPPSLSRSPRAAPELPQVAVTTPFDVRFGDLTTPDGSGTSSYAAAHRATQYFTPTEPEPPSDVLKTPIPSFGRMAGSSNMDYFNSKISELPPTHDSQPSEVMRTPRPADYDGIPVPRTVPMPCSSPRPGLYHQGSKSMVDLLSLTRKERDTSIEEHRKSHAPDYVLATTTNTFAESAGAPVVQPIAGGPAPPALRRQRSLPMYTTATEPPPYPSFVPHRARPPPIQPREEEGREQLPVYTNSIFLAAVMPRKMEFVGPGIQSRDRKWKRALCILEGTAFKVYKVHTGVVEDWWERTVGIGDRTSIDPGAIGAAGTIRVSAIRETARASEQNRERWKGEPSPDPSALPPSPSASASTMPQSRSKFQLATSLLHPSKHKANALSVSSSNSRSRMSLDTQRDENRSGSGISPRRQSLDSSRSLGLASTGGASSRRASRNNSSDNAVASSSASTSATSDTDGSVSRQSSDQIATTSHFSSLSGSSLTLDREPDPKDLVRQYTLQNAESGLASDYLKRKNVIRVRMEGEQFLLQAKDVPAVIDWIEGIQAATNVALDLDERPMPKGPIFPRRRRRRPRRPDGQGQTPVNATSSTASSQSATRSGRGP